MRTEVSVTPNELDRSWGYGSKAVIDLLDQEDNLLAAYRPSKIREGMTLQQGIEVACNRVKAHCDPIALGVDGNCCAMGGHIHVATVTLDEGFRWVPQFEPMPHA